MATAFMLLADIKPDVDKASVCFFVGFIALLLIGILWIATQKPRTMVIWLGGLGFVAGSVVSLGLWFGTP